MSSVQSRRTRSVLLTLAIVAAIVGGGWYIYERTGDNQTGPNKRSASVPVTLATVTKGDVDVVDRGLGTVTPITNITVKTQINGQLQEVAYQEGQLVHQGDLLVQIDARPYQAALEQAQGALTRDQALLKDAQLDLARYQKLVAQDSISKQQLDTQTALVQQYQGDVVTDQGQIDAASLNIAYCHIVAPITGRVGLRQVDVGNYVQTSDANGIVVLTQLDPISVLFTLPEDWLPAVMKELAAGNVLQTDAYDRAETVKLATGKLTAVDTEIDPTTGTVKMRAQFDNPDGVLFPNQFVNVHLRVNTIRDAVLAPQAAILRGAPGTFVYLTKDDDTVAVRPVKLGVTQGDNVQITDGLAPGNQVVIDGTDKLRDGAKYKLPENASSGGDTKSADAKNSDAGMDGAKGDDASDTKGQKHHHRDSNSNSNTQSAQ